MTPEQKEPPALDRWSASVRDHPLRACITAALANGPTETDELAKTLGVSPSRVAYHRGVLEKAGAVPPGAGR